MVASHVMAMNVYWYIYMHARGSKLAKLVGEDTMQCQYKAAAEEAAWEYQDAVWTSLVWLVRHGDRTETTVEWARGPILTGFES